MCMFKKILFFLLIFANISAQARWSTIDDVDLEYKFYNQKIKISKNGTSEATVETRQKILKEAARSKIANYTLHYNGDAASITILEAKTIYDGKEYNVTPDMIEDKPLASSPDGFDQQRQVKISFPKIEIGSEIYLKYIEKETNPPLDGFYSAKFYYGNGGYWQSCNLILESEIPLHLKVNDPENVLKITKDKEDKFSKIEATLTKAHCRDAINEPEAGILSHEHLTFISISTIEDWNLLAKRLATHYEQVIEQDLPKMFNEIVKKASGEKDEIEQINIVTSLLNKKIQYFGDWRAVNGRFFPRDLEKIATSQIADCKDFTASAATILNKLGYKVQAALVKRGIYASSYNGGLPDISDFNHAFLKLTNKDNKVYWIDPTNDVSMAQHIFPDVADKMALVLDSNHPNYERTPAPIPEDSKSILLHELAIDGNKITNSGEASLLGTQAARMTGAKLYTSDQMIEDLIFSILSGTDIKETDRKMLILPNLDSRIVRDMTIKFEYDQDNQLTTTNLGSAIRTKFLSLKFIVYNVQHQVTDLDIGVPRTMITKTIIKNMLVEHIENLNCEIDTKWLSVKRKCSYNGENTEIEETAILKKRFILNEELETPEYQTLKEYLIKNFVEPLVVLSKVKTETPKNEMESK